MTNKFGVGIITTQSRELHPNLLNLIDQPTTFCVETDLDRTGVSRTRNRVMKKLFDSGCEYIVLFDDDCYPIKYGWQSYLESVHKDSGLWLLTMPKDDHKSLGVVGQVENVQWGIGAFTSLTRNAIVSVGYFNTEYDTYGYEDVAYLYRCRRIGLSLSEDADASPVDINKYIYSIDCDPNASSAPSLLSQEEKGRLIDKNKEVFHREISSDNNWYPYVG